MNLCSSAAIDAIFGRMAVRYGSAWFAKWDGVPIETVKADWARELGGFSREAIVYALGYLPADFPPSVTQFRDTCARAPERMQKRIAQAIDREGKARIDGELRRIAESISRRSPLAWAYELQEREAAGEVLNETQRKAWRDAMTASPINTVSGEFTPIPDHCLPPAMRAEITEDERMAA